MSKPFLENYGGQTIQQLIAMKDSHRIDSLVLAVEQALGSKPEGELSEPERVVLAVEAMERELYGAAADADAKRSATQAGGPDVKSPPLGSASRGSSRRCVPVS